MPLQIVVPDEDITYLNQPAIEELRSSLERYCDRLLKEASRLEATSTGTAADPQITSSMISDADLLLRRAYRRPRKKLWVIIAQLVSPVTGIITGVLVDLELLTSNPGWLVTFMVFLSISIIATVVAVLKE